MLLRATRAGCDSPCMLELEAGRKMQGVVEASAFKVRT